MEIKPELIQKTAVYLIHASIMDDRTITIAIYKVYCLSRASSCKQIIQKTRLNMYKPVQDVNLIIFIQFVPSLG